MDDTWDQKDDLIWCVLESTSTLGEAIQAREPTTDLMMMQSFSLDRATAHSNKGTMAFRSLAPSSVSEYVLPICR